jgi:hypothetical protein
MPTIDHDWEDAEFELSDYQTGSRLKQTHQEVHPSSQPKKARKIPEPKGRPKLYENYGMEDPSDDPVLFAEYDESEQDSGDEYFKRVKCA